MCACALEGAKPVSYRVGEGKRWVMAGADASAKRQHSVVGRQTQAASVGLRMVHWIGRRGLPLFVSESTS